MQLQSPLLRVFLPQIFSQIKHKKLPTKRSGKLIVSHTIHIPLGLNKKVATWKKIRKKRKNLLSKNVLFMTFLFRGKRKRKNSKKSSLLCFTEKEEKMDFIAWFFFYAYLHLHTDYWGHSTCRGLRSFFANPGAQVNFFLLLRPSFKESHDSELLGNI